MKCTLVLLLVLALPVASMGVEPTVPDEYARIRVVTKDQQRLEIFDATVSPDHIRFEAGGREGSGRTSRSNKDIKLSSPIDIENVSFLEVQTGTKAGKYALLGGAGGLLGGLLGILSVQADPNYELKGGGTVAAVLAAVTIVPAGIGALIGSTNPEFVPLRREGRWLDNVRVGLNPASGGTTALVRMSF